MALPMTVQYVSRETGETINQKEERRRPPHKYTINGTALWTCLILNPDQLN